VKRKQRLSFNDSSETFACVLPVPAGINVAVGLLRGETETEEVKNVELRSLC
jgi:hypothetical protein